MFEEHDRIILTEKIAEHQLVPGDIGVIVYIHPGRVGYEVEFVTLAGETKAVVELDPSQIRPISSSEIPHARDLQAV